MLFCHRLTALWAGHPRNGLQGVEGSAMADPGETLRSLLKRKKRKKKRKKETKKRKKERKEKKKEKKGKKERKKVSSDLYNGPSDFHQVTV
jgi:membrane peptidoglycan carboxypeptidase